MTNIKHPNLGDKIPLFLRKTYNMINACDASIAAWSEDGLSFAVKDVDLFASKILCQYFKHNNVSSFVRQLNLYGFRKIRSSNNYDDMESKYWRFKHEYFQRERHDLLSQIRKASQQHESAEKSEVEKLKVEVEELRTTISTMSAQLSELSSVLTNFAMNNNSQAQRSAAVCSLPSIISPSAGVKRTHDSTYSLEEQTIFVSNGFVPSCPAPASVNPSPCKKQKNLSTIADTNFASCVPSSNISCVSSDSSCSSGTPELDMSSPLCDEFGLSMPCNSDYEKTLLPFIEDIRSIETMHFDSGYNVSPNSDAVDNYHTQMHVDTSQQSGIQIL